MKMLLITYYRVYLLAVQENIYKLSETRFTDASGEKWDGICFGLHIDSIELCPLLLSKKQTKKASTCHS